MKDLALEQAASQINWPLVFYICLALFVLYVLHNVIGLSFSHFVREIVREFRELIGPGKVTRGRLNALLIIALVCLVGFYAFVDPIKHLIHLAGNMRHPEEPENGYVEVAAVFLVGLAGMISVLASAKE